MIYPASIFCAQRQSRLRAYGHYVFCLWHISYSVQYRWKQIPANPASNSITKTEPSIRSTTPPVHCNIIVVIWRHRTWSTLIQAMACCQRARIHYLEQCWLIINDAMWHSHLSLIWVWKLIIQYLRRISRGPMNKKGMGKCDDKHNKTAHIFHACVVNLLIKIQTATTRIKAISLSCRMAGRYFD